MIFKPSGVRGVLVKVLRRDVVMLARRHAAKAAEKALRLIGADASDGIALTVIDARGRKERIQRIPMEASSAITEEPKAMRSRAISTPSASELRTKVSVRPLRWRSAITTRRLPV